MTHRILFDPALGRHALRRALPPSVTVIRITRPPSFARDLREFGATFLIAFVTFLTLFG